MNGSNNTGCKFVAKKVYEGIPLPLPESAARLQKGTVINYQG